MYSDRKQVLNVSGTRTIRFACTALLVAAASSLAGCGNSYRPVVSSINPVGPASQPTKFAVAISNNATTGLGLVSIIDFSGDTILDTTALGRNPYYLMLDAGGTQGNTLNGDGTLNTFPLSTSLIAANVLQTTLPANANPVAIYSFASTGAGLASLYITQQGRSSVGQYQGAPPAIKQEFQTGGTPVYTVGSTSGARAYTLVQQGAATPGKAVAIETITNTVSGSIPVGINPVYGVMSIDLSSSAARRAFVLNNGSNSVSVINAQTNALDTFTVNGAVTSTIPVGVAPVWADLAPTLNELMVVNQGNGTTPGTLSIISIPLCSVASVTSNPNCDAANPIDAVGFGSVIATVPVGINPVMVAVLADGSRAYVANAGNPATGVAGSVSVVNLTTNTVTTTIPGGGTTGVNDIFLHGHPNFLALTDGIPTGKVYLTSADSSDITVIRTDTDSVTTHLSLQGVGVMVRTNRP